MHAWKTWSAALILAVAFTLPGCDAAFAPSEGEDFFFVKREGARFPVWARGDLDSDTFIVIIHGGPGSTGTQYFHLDAYEGLEDRYGVVYWEQRASGYSRGTGRGGQEHLNATRAARDVDSIVDVVRSNYEPERLFLIGHSWGGVLGTAYLALEPERQDKIDGWIEVNGGHNWRLGQELSVEWVRARAEEFIADPSESRFGADHWEEALEWYDDNPLGEWDRVNSMAWIRQHTQYVDDADGYFVRENRSIIDRLDDVPGLRWHGFMSFSTQWAWFNDRNPPLWESQYDATAAIMDRITLPSLIVWGRHDGILPVELADDAYERLGTPRSDKSIVIFEDSAHSPMFEQPDAFNRAVIDFIEANR
jgi:pimeloyl-ACP methyl ester carboxylesterase